MLGLRDDDTVVDFVDAFQQVINQGRDGTFQFDRTEAFLAGDRRAASAQGRGVANSVGFDVFIVGVEDESGYIALVLSGQGVLNGYFQMVRDIAATVDFEPINGQESSHNSEGQIRLVSSTAEPFGELTLAYPEGWVANAQPNGLISFATDLETLESRSIVPEPGHAVGQAMVLPTSDFTALFGIAPDSSAAELLEAIANDQSNSVPIQRQPIQEFTIGGRDAAMLIVSLQNDDLSADGIIFVIEESHGYTVLQINTAKGETDEYVDIARTMAESLFFQPH